MRVGERPFVAVWRILRRAAMRLREAPQLRSVWLGLVPLGLREKLARTDFDFHDLNRRFPSTPFELSGIEGRP
jgi:hypothetical protein